MEYTDLRTPVAFSGTVVDPDTSASYTEAGFNHFPEGQLPERFDADDYQVLIVAEKYQTGYDQPLLHTMYVDKKLTGIKAVQTLCRLNRRTEGKMDTFVLDFANDSELIQASFMPFYDTPIAEPTDLNVLYNAASRVEEAGIVIRDEAVRFAALLLNSGTKSPLTPTAHAGLYALLEPALVRFSALQPQKQEDFRQATVGHVRIYAFLSQVLTWIDPHLESLYLYCRYLSVRLPRQEVGSIDLGDDVVLTHLRTQLIAGQQNLSLGQTPVVEEPVGGFTGEGVGPLQPPKDVQLSALIETLNERFGTEFTKSDQLYFDQLQQSMVEDPDLAVQANANTEENFGFGFDKSFLDQVMGRRDGNEAIFARLINDHSFAEAVKSALRPIVYQTLRSEKPDNQR